MLLPIPGFSYLKASEGSTPPHPVLSSPAAPVVTPVSREIITEARRRIRIVLDVIFRIRPPSHLEKAGLSSVATRLLRRRMAERSDNAGPVRVDSLHVREAVDGPDFEIYGCCSSRAQGWAFLALFGPPSGLPVLIEPQNQGRDANHIPAVQEPRCWQIHSFRLLSPHR
ncbi:hypothetical protein GP475_03235 [Corynebacterium poyangense]|uniref:Uncharacterized protein n=1 Tax=Corynebacterium poyangense TaxID=2684405 RepID=A0A7H0SMJ6_9CORY|nr:hypothetical protein [Corynebacterium poyangense]MBZ8176877.1 hypothetical protein [Corynebacterium poyangense]QNQ89771.1 hypothetical protein GP475_03235 [Corynebacterium poyangense]